MIKKIYLLMIFYLLAGCQSTETLEKRDKLAQKNMELATEYLNAGQFLKATVRLKKALEINPDLYKAYGILGIIYQNQGEYKLSEENFLQALNIAPNNSDIRNNYGTLLYTTGRYKKAIWQFKKVTDDIYYGKRDRVFENLATTCLKAGYPDQAIKYYKHALRLNPTLSNCYLMLGKILLKHHEPQQAYDYYTKFVSTGGIQNAKSLWIGIQICRQINNPTDLAIYTKKLKENFSFSPEYKKYLQTQ